MTQLRRLRSGRLRSGGLLPGSGGTRLGLVLGLLVLLPTTAFAHTGAGPAHGFLHGFGHPLLGVDHLLAMIAVGLLAGQRGGRAVWALPVAFIGAMLAGGAVGMTGLHVPGVEGGIVASVLVMGALIALAVRFPLVLGMVAVAGFALFHGHAHGAEMPAATSGLLYGVGFAASTALLHGVGIALVMAGRSAQRAHTGAAMRPALVRLTGAAISLAGAGLWLAG